MTDADEYTRRQFDEPWDFTVSGGASQDFKLRYDFPEFAGWLKAEFDVVSWSYVDYRNSPKPYYSFVVEYRKPVGESSQSEPQTAAGECMENERRIIMLEGATPRFLVGFIRSFRKRLPSNTDLVTVIHPLTYARFDPSLSDEEAMIKMMTDDEDLMRELGVVQ